MTGIAGSWRRWRWLAVVVPIALVALVEILSDTVLDRFLPFPFDTALVVATTTVCAVALAGLAFRAIARLTAALDAQNRALRRQIEAGRALQRVGLAVREATRIDEALQLIVDEARRLLDTDLALLVLEDSEGGVARLIRSDPDDLLVEPLPAESTGGNRAAPGSLDPLLPSSRFPFRWEIPVQRGLRRFGRLVVGHRSPRTAGADEGEILVALANHAAIALEHDRLERELRVLAVHAERERIAREMHDGLSQVLGYVNTKSQAVEALLVGGRTDEARRQLRELAAAARSVYVDVREAILGLTNPIDPERGLLAALETYAGAFAEAAKVAVDVRPDENARRLRLPPATEAELFKVVQEALTNVRKHAAAQRVSIDIRVPEGALEIAVADDGRGFDPATAGGGDWPHYGLRTMAERLATLGGRCEIVSRPGAGTTVRVRVPLHPGSPKDAGESVPTGTAR